MLSMQGAEEDFMDNLVTRMSLSKTFFAQNPARSISMLTHGYPNDLVMKRPVSAGTRLRSMQP